MKTRPLHLGPLLAAMVLALIACTEEQETGIPPCTPLPGSERDPCEGPTRAAIGPHSIGSAPDSVEAYVDGFGSLGGVAHVVARGQFLPWTIRCVPNRKDREHGYWDNPLTFNVETGLRDVLCFGDIQVAEYIVGTGPNVLTILAHVFEFGDPDAWDEEIAELLKASEDNVRKAVTGYEMVYFLGPATNAAIEAWEPIFLWDLERRDDGTVIVVHPDRDYWLGVDTSHRDKVEFTLPAFRREAQDAHRGRIADHGGRIQADESLPMIVTDAARLYDFHVETGNADHEDGMITPPPIPCGLVWGNADILADCEALLATKDTLAGTADLNWVKGRPLETWDGIAVGGWPERITKVELDDEDLAASIPAQLRNLTALTHLDLSNNALTGTIPSELGLLQDLQELRLSGNTLTGCIPPPLLDIPTHDLDDLGLPDCTE